MSGHSKWHSIKHRKAVTDARRGKLFSKLAKMITVAAKQGGGDSEKNFRLRLAMAKAKEANMPAANIDRAIKSGTGESKSTIEELVYEGYGPGGVAILLEIATDNRNRTASEVRSTLTKYGGRLGETGSVSWQFESRGVITAGNLDDSAELELIDAGAADINSDSQPAIIYTQPAGLDKVKRKAEELGLEVQNADLELVPKQTVRVEDEKTATQLFKLLEALEELDDVTRVNANYDVEDSLLEQAAK